MMEGLRARGAFLLYQQEIEYLFFTQGIGWNILFIFQKGGTLTKEEWKVIAGIASKMLFSIQENRYVKNERYLFYQAWNDVLLAVLDMDHTEEGAEMADHAMKKCVRAFSTCPAFF